MADIYLNSDGDIEATNFGDIAVVTSYDEITQTAVNNIKLIYGEDQFHTDIGNMAYNRRLKISESSLEVIKNDCISAVLKDTRVDKVVSMTVSYSDTPNTLDIAFTLMVIDGTMVSNKINIDRGAVQ